MPHVIIALSTYNGARHLDAQLKSYALQTHAQWDLWVSDDGSTDETMAILERWRQKWQGAHALRVLNGPRQGAAINFLSLLCHQDFPDDAIVALSDQDDVWLQHKLARGIGKLAEHAPNDAVLYGAQSLHVDTDLQPIGHSRTAGLRPCFQNALAQNIVSGHTMMLNPAALCLVRNAGVPAKVPYHDWWLYQLITGAGGRVIIDSAEVLKYRQHSGNLMGAHQGTRARRLRLRQLIDGTYGDWFDENTRALAKVAPLLTPENRALVKVLANTPRRPGIARMRALRSAGLHRHGRAAQLFFTGAALLGRV